jgi:hypothetical protein
VGDECVPAKLRLDVGSRDNLHSKRKT